MAANALPGGISGYSGKGGTSVCSGCHSGTATAPTLALTGPATLTAGMTGNYTLTLTGGPGKAAGMDASLSGANSGSVVFTPGTGNKLNSGDLVHSAPLTFIANAASFTFSIKAPLTAGVFTISAAGLSTSGDGTGKTSLDVTVSAAAGSPPTGTPDSGTVPPPVIPSPDAGTAPVASPDAGTAPAPHPTVTPDGGSVAPVAPPAVATPTGGSTAPLSDGVVEGEGCTAVGGAPFLGLFALAGLFFARRRR